MIHVVGGHTNALNHIRFARLIEFGSYLEGGWPENPLLCVWPEELTGWHFFISKHIAGLG